MAHHIILFFTHWLPTAPTIISLAEILLAQGHQVTICTYESPTQPHINFTSGIDVHSIKLPSRKLSTIGLELLPFGLDLLHSLILEAEFRKHTPRIFWACDDVGAIAAKTFHLRPYIYVSTELPARPLSAPISRQDRAHLKAFEGARAVVIQDRDRLLALTGSGEPIVPHFFLPNGAKRQTSRELEVADYFRELLNINRETHPNILLYAGSLEQVFLPDEILKAARTLKNTAMVIHCRSFDEPRFAELLQMENIYLSMHPVPFDEVHKIFNSTDIGLAFYEEPDDNYSLIGRASGKLAQYLKFGKPVIVNDSPSIKGLVEQYKCGIAISDPAELASAVDLILSDYNAYSLNALECFENEYALEPYVEPLLRWVEQNLASR